VETDKMSYIQREVVNIEGNVSFQGELVPNGLIGIQVENPLRTIILRTLSLATNISSEQFLIEISSLFFCDQYGNKIDPVTERNRNIWVSIKVKNKGISPRTVYVSLTILDNSLIPLDVGTAIFTIPAGQTNVFASQMYIPNWATIGTAMIFGNVYTSFPKDGGYPLCPENTSQFNIIESIYAENPPTSFPPSETTPNGTYKMSFRLPPDMLPGTYYVTASAWYIGFTGSSSTFFNTECIPLPPWPSFVIKPPIAGPDYTITFDASFSSPEGYNDTITTYHWNFGDNSTTSGKIVTHSYSQLGNYTVTLNVTDNEGFWNTTSKVVTIAIIHDIAILNVDYINTVYDNWIVYFTVTIKNKGTSPENFNVTLYSNETQVSKQQLTIGIQQIKKITISWDTTGIEVKANYSLKVEADILEDEINIEDNVLTFGPIATRKIGDVIDNGDYIIDIYDLTAVCFAYGSSEGEPNWYLMADLLKDGKIDIYDVTTVCIMYNYKY
jgi:hypothetical protein